MSYGEAEAEPAQDEPFSFTLVVASLPPPAAWDEIAREVEKLPAPQGGNSKAVRGLSLRLLAHRLAGNTAAEQADMAMLDDDFKGQSPSTDEQSDLDSLHKTLSGELTPGEEEFKQETGWLNDDMEKKDGEPPGFQVEDLVTMAGSDNATAFLRNAMIAYAKLQINAGDQGGKTSKLAHDVALELVRPMKLPQWGLVNSVDDVDLYEALLKRFPPPAAGATDSDSGYVLANGKWRLPMNNWYLRGLIKAGRLDDATAYAPLNTKGAKPGMTPFDADDLDDGADLLQLTWFFHDLLAKTPDLPFWEFYVSAGPMAGKRKEMTAILEATAKRGDLPDAWKNQIEGHLKNAMLADGRIDEAVAMIRNEKDDYVASQLEFLGKLLGRKDLAEQPAQLTRPLPHSLTQPPDAEMLPRLRKSQATSRATGTPPRPRRSSPKACRS